jgi:hypothetical protein
LERAARVRDCVSFFNRRQQRKTVLSLELNGLFAAFASGLEALRAGSVSFCLNIPTFPHNLAPDSGQYTCERPEKTSQND